MKVAAILFKFESPFFKIPHFIIRKVFGKLKMSTSLTNPYRAHMVFAIVEVTLAYI